MKNDLISKFPEIAKEWHPSMNYDADKNIDLKPGNFSYGSKVKIWWQCSKGHEWQASIVNRTHGGTGCPYCAGRHGIAVSDKSNKLNLIRHILENTNFTLNPQIKTHSQQSFFQNISTVKASITYLYFNTDRCLKAEGHGTGELIDLFGMFPQLIGIGLDLTCKENLFEISIKSTLEDVLEGEMLIKTNSEYSLEVKSKRLSNKILEISKLKFKKGPSFKISGRLDELMNVN